MKIKDIIWKCKKRIHRLFKWEVPYALPINLFSKDPNELTWEKWKMIQRTKQPFKYFIFETIPDQIGYIANYFDNLYYYIRCNTINRYHFLDLRQPKGSYYEYRWGYCDVVQKMVYANFNLLVEYIDLEYDGIKNAKHALLQLKEMQDVPPGQVDNLEKAIKLYMWWKFELPNMHKEHDAILHEAVGNKIDGTRNYDELKLKQSWEMQQNIDDTTNAKLKELIDIRMSLWT